ncbi:DUF4267 domain-containing protein [Pseudoalteromonas sp. OOF1S-7]|uniref:DUF4267 domain-containing protein n=1 Tax=Pseudoalteromonas sp. OOF1S-7 TaxID=2917757 RepID=UPI001EF6CE74|nr:DUF4267 domain-containing protein [Pseudoalteromonas sp. OOF1S-7]MCG7537023.1 DUF4267 domain-containing protein [Pseudoalteromonas sp. OOF1S-7]
MIKKVAFTLVLLMAVLQGFYALFAYIQPIGFSDIRGTVLASPQDLDWIHIYASRTLFVSLIIGVLLYFRNYKTLFWAALLGTVMPLTDGWLAYQSGASVGVIAKHVVTVAYLLVTALVLHTVVKTGRCNHPA